MQCRQDSEMNRSRPGKWLAHPGKFEEQTANRPVRTFAVHQTEYVILIALCVITCALLAQSSPDASLEARVKQELGVFYRDNPGPDGAIEVRLRKLGDQKAIAGVLIDLIGESTDLIDENFRPGSPDPDNRFVNLVGAISALGKLKEPDAIPVLTMVAKRATKTSELEVLAILSISEIDPAGSVPLLVDALHNPQYIVRLSAAQGLSKTSDQAYCAPFVPSAGIEGIADKLW